MKKTISLVLAISVGLFSVLLGQTIFISNKSRLNNRKNQFHRPIGIYNDQLYTLDFSNYQLETGFTIEKYDAQLGFSKSREFKVPHRNWVLKIFLCDSTLYWVTLNRQKRGKIDVQLFSIPVGLEGEPKQQIVGSFDWGEIGPSDVWVDYSPSKRNWVLAIFYNSSSRGFQPLARVGFLIADVTGLNKYVDTVLNTKNSAFDLEWKSLEINNSGEVAACFYDEDRLEKTSMFAGKKQEQSEAFQYLMVGNSIHQGLCEAVGSIRDAMIYCHPNTGNFYLGGYFQEPDSKGLDGCFIRSLKLSKDSLVLLHWFSESEQRTLMGNLNSRRTEKVQNFEAREIVALDNGGWLLIGEQYYITRQMETYYVNGLPQNTTRQFYHYGNLGLNFLNVDLQSSGEPMDSIVVIPKNQVSSNSGAHLLGYGMYVCKKSLNFIYNDNESEANRIMHIKINNRLDMEKGWLFRQESIIGEIIPDEGKQIDYCMFAVPVIRSKEWYWMQILSND
jgi:hypothetical protein